MELESTEISVRNGENLFVRDHRPPFAEDSPIFVSVHGLGEHGGRYAHLADWLVNRGWRVIACDLRGHGRSSGSRTHVLSFAEYSQDLANLWQHYELKSKRTVLFGHSMGGLVVVRAVEEGAVMPNAMVLSSPLLGLKMHVNPLKVFLGSFVVRILPRLRFSNGLDPKNMTLDAIFSEERARDPFIDKTVTAGWFFAMRHAIMLAHRDAAKVSIPVFAVRGMADETTDGDALARWMTEIKSSSRELVSLPAHVHEVFHESDWRETAERMANWLERLGLSIRTSSPQSQS